MAFHTRKKKSRDNREREIKANEHWIRELHGSRGMEPSLEDRLGPNFASSYLRRDPMHKNMPLVNKAKAPLTAVGSISGTTGVACANPQVAATTKSRPHV